MFKIVNEVYPFLILVGFPTAFIALLKSLMRKIKMINDENESLKSGVQALLRDRLYDIYVKYIDKGYAPLYVKDNFKNMYEKYHTLGENGVMDAIYEKFMDLPETEKERNSIC